MAQSKGKDVRLRRVYTDRDKLIAYAKLKMTGMDDNAVGGNLKRTAREMNIPSATIRDWRKDWQANGGPSEEDLEEVESMTDDYVSRVEEIRDLVLDQMRKVIPRTTSLAQLTSAYGVTTDKLAVAKGQPTNRTEHTMVLPSKEEWKEILSPYAEALHAAASQRAAEIIDVEVIEQSPKELEAPR